MKARHCAILLLLAALGAQAETELERRRRAPPPPPLPAEVYSAYEFRFHLLGNAECSRFAQQADDILNNLRMKDEDKARALQPIGSAARAANCMPVR